MEIGNETTPMRRSDLTCRVVDDEALLHDAHRDATHRLNCTAYLIWEQCDGTRTCDAIAQRMAKAWQTTPEKARSDVLGLIREMAKHKLVEVLR